MSRDETTGLVIELREVIAEVNLHPLTASFFRVASGHAHEFRADAFPLIIGAYLRVDQERMVAAVPGHIHEPDEVAAVEARGYPPKAVGADPVPPARLRLTAVGLGQSDEFVIGGFAAP